MSIQHQAPKEHVKCRNRSREVGPALKGGATYLLPLLQTTAVTGGRIVHLWRRHRVTQFLHQIFRIESCVLSVVHKTQNA